ncbi:MAG: methyltransferase domain-containing protein [Ketobacter sp.]|uniref:methyltransferase domain-containing protein n=1 Tax=Ketobacter sp. MCCC 1A13808 TaxID=2602738 RepID=UPI0018DDB4AF|nr:methyltransferase domain-containing protein [Ketobacter sp. MCCC 1A13808]
MACQTRRITVHGHFIIMSLPRLFKPFQQIHGSFVHQLLNKWFKSELGKEILQQEKALLERLLPSMFGYNLVQTGFGEPHWLAESSTIHNKIYLCEQPQYSGYYRCVCSHLDELALATESVDVAILHHSLDFASAPHRVLREMSRVVIPGGKIVIVGFNPWSLWGVFRFVQMHSIRMPWSGNFISAYRLSDWLKLLDFHVEGYESTAYGLPTANDRTRKLFNWISYLGQRVWRQRGGVYVLVATKQVSTLTPIKPRFSSVTDSLVHIPIAGIAKPSIRNHWNKTNKRET